MAKICSKKNVKYVSMLSYETQFFNIWTKYKINYYLICLLQLLLPIHILLFAIDMKIIQFIKYWYWNDYTKLSIFKLSQNTLYCFKLIIIVK